MSVNRLLVLGALTFYVLHPFLFPIFLKSIHLCAACRMIENRWKFLNGRIIWFKRPDNHILLLPFKNHWAAICRPNDLYLPVILRRVCGVCIKYSVLQTVDKSNRYNDTNLLFASIPSYVAQLNITFQFVCCIYRVASNVMIVWCVEQRKLSS